MPWYRFYCTYGPGHPSSAETYRYYNLDAQNDEWVEDFLKEKWQEWCRQEWLEDAIGGQESVKELPEKERQLQIRKYRSRLKAAYEMLLVLGADKEES